MRNLLVDMFHDQSMRERLKKKLPYMFWVAEKELSRGGHVGMEVGTLREKILVALLMYKFGADRVKEPPINSPQADVIIESHHAPISIKTKTGRGHSGVKLVWTVDWQKVEEFYRTYEPSTDLIMAVVDWSRTGFFSLRSSDYSERHLQGFRERKIYTLP